MVDQNITTKCIVHVDIMLPSFVPILTPPIYSHGDEIVKLHLKKVEKVLLLLQCILHYSSLILKVELLLVHIVVP